MIKTLEERKLAYLQQLEEKYKPRKKFWQSGSAYFPVHEIGKQSKGKPNPNNVYVYSLEKMPEGVWILLIITIIAIIIFKEAEFLYLILAIDVMLILKFMMAYFDRRVKLKIDSDGIFYGNLKYFISWDDIIALYLKEEYGESTDYKLVIHFYYPSNDEFSEECLSIDELDSHYKDICFALAYMQQQWQKQVSALASL